MDHTRSRDVQRRGRLTAAPALALGVALAACGNPALDDRIDALGDEVPGVEPSAFHRPGQPCVLCHGPYFGAQPELSIGGTIFATDRGRVPVEGAVVRIWDSVGDSRELTTNCIGNFFAKKEDWDPLFPLKVEVEFGLPGKEATDRRLVGMSSRIEREGSCAGCHVDNKSEVSQTQASPGRVYCVEQEQADGDGIKFPALGPACPGKLP